MTEKVFWQNPYQTQLVSAVRAIRGCDIELAQTIIYAESGGQESDHATINDIAVVKAQKQGQQLIYTLASAPDFKVGEQVVTSIDWPRRYALMKLHFAAELVLEIVTRDYSNMHKIGAHIAADKSRIDFISPTPVQPLLADIEHQVQALIDADLEVESAFSDQQSERRYWQVAGFAKVPCGGTHIRRTSEVQGIRLKRKNIGKGKERVEIRLCPKPPKE